MKNLFWRFGLLAALAPLALVWGQTAPYSYYFSSNLNPIQSGSWTQNGTWGDPNSQASLISTVPVSDGTNEYEVNTKLTLTVSGGNYQQFFRASANALNNTGTYTMVQLTPSFNVYGCTGTLTQWDVLNGIATQLSQATVPCYNGMNLRSVIYGNTISTLINGEVYVSTTSNTGGGQPGVRTGLQPGGERYRQCADRPAQPRGSGRH